MNTNVMKVIKHKKNKNNAHAFNFNNLYTFIYIQCKYTHTYLLDIHFRIYI